MRTSQDSTAERRLIIVGAGGHSKVVADAWEAAGGGALCFADDSAAGANGMWLGWPVLGAPSEVVGSDDSFHVAIGDNRTRARLLEHLVARGAQPRTIMHPAAVVSRNAVVGDGVLVAAGAIVAPGSRIGLGCIVNHGAVVDHDVVVGRYCHIAPRVTLGGGVLVGDFAMVGAGTTILPHVAIGKGALVGAGSLVNRDVPAGEVFYGVPARRARKK